MFKLFNARYFNFIFSQFFDTNGQRMYVISGNMFRPPVILSSGTSIILRFYANGGSDFGFKASYSFILGVPDELAFMPDMGESRCLTTSIVNE